VQLDHHQGDLLKLEEVLEAHQEAVVHEVLLDLHEAVVLEVVDQADHEVVVLEALQEVHQEVVEHEAAADQEAAQNLQVALQEKEKTKQHSIFINTLG